MSRSVPVVPNLRYVNPCDVQLSQFFCTYSRNAKLAFRLFAVELIGALIPRVLANVHAAPTPHDSTDGGDEIMPGSGKRRIDSLTMVTPADSCAGARRHSCLPAHVRLLWIR